MDLGLRVQEGKFEKQKAGGQLLPPIARYEYAEQLRRQRRGEERIKHAPIILQIGSKFCEVHLQLVPFGANDDKPLACSK